MRNTLIFSLYCLRKHYYLIRKDIEKQYLILSCFDIIWIIILEGMNKDRDSKFFQRYQEAKRKRNTNKNQAILIMKQALQIDFKAEIDGWQNYYPIKIEMGDLQKQIKQFQSSYQTLHQVIDELERTDIIPKVENRNEVKKLKYSAYQNVAKLLVKMACLSTASTNYDKYRKQTNQSFQYFKQAQKIVVFILLVSKFQTSEIGWWKVQYLKLKSNEMQLIFQEAEQFQDLQLFQVIIDQTNKVEKFYKMNQTQEGKAHLFRCYYYKSISLLLLNRTNQSLELLKKDLQYEKSHNQPEDAEKTRSQILRAYLNLNNMREAYRYVVSKQQKQLLQYIKSRRQKMKKIFSKGINEIKTYSRQFFLQIFQDIDLNSNQYTYDYEETDRCLYKIVDVFKDKSDVQSLIYYYLAEVNLKIKRYKQAEAMIEEALKLPIEDSHERRDYAIERFMIKTKTETDQLAIQKIYQVILKEIESVILTNGYLQDYQTQKKNLTQAYRQYQMFCKKRRENILYTFASDQEEQLLSKMSNSDRQHRGFQQELMQIEDDEDQSNHNTKTKATHKLVRYNPQEEYVSACQGSVPIRQEIKQQLKGSLQFNPFSEIINLSLKQLEILLKFVKTENLDLRNHAINDLILQTILNNEIYSTVVRKFKMNGSNRISHQILLRVLLKFTQLNYLSFLNFSMPKPRSFNLLENKQRRSHNDEMPMPKSIVNMLFLMDTIPSHNFANNLNLGSIKTLKLKYCNLMDDHLLEMEIKNFVSLSEISLSHNLLRGERLQQIMNLPKIAEINLSDNPLVELCLDKWKRRWYQEDNFEIRSLKLKNVRLVAGIRRELVYILDRVRCIDLSECQQIADFIDQIQMARNQGKVNLGRLQKIGLQRIDLDKVVLFKLLTIPFELNFRREIDLRGCKYSFNTQDYLTNFVRENPNIIIKRNIGHQEKEIQSNFSLLKPVSNRVFDR